MSSSPEISQLLDFNIPHQLSIPYNTTNIHNAQLAQLYNMLTMLFTSYINSNNIGADLPSPEEQEDHDTKPFIDNSYKHLLYHNTLQEILQVELSPDFIQQCDDFHQYDILHSIIKYVRHSPTQLTVNLVENIFYIWPQYIALVNTFIGWVDQIEIFMEAEVYYTETYDLLADSLEDQIYLIEHSIHKRIQIVASRYYKRHRLILDTSYSLQITPDMVYSNYQDSSIIQEIQYLFQDDQEIETTKLILSQLPFTDTDDIELHNILFYTEEFQ